MIRDVIERLGQLLKHLLLRGAVSKAPFDIPSYEFLTELNEANGDSSLEYVQLLHHLRDDCYDQWFIAAVRLRGERRCRGKRCHMCPTPEFCLPSSTADEVLQIDVPTEARLNKPVWMRF